MNKFFLTVAVLLSVAIVIGLAGPNPPPSIRPPTVDEAPPPQPHQRTPDRGSAPSDPFGDEPSPPDPRLNYEAVLIAAVHHFVQNGEDDYLVILLDRHPSLVNATRRFREPRKPGYGDDYTPLHWAVEKGRVATVNLLLKRKADVHADGGGGWTPLHLAAKYGKIEVCRVLLKNGANAAARTTALPERCAPCQMDSGARGNAPAIKLRPEPALTPLDIAHEKKYQAVVDLLVAHMKDAKGQRKK